jgi:hypothetical protein
MVYRFQKSISGKYIIIPFALNLKPDQFVTFARKFKI